MKLIVTLFLVVGNALLTAQDYTMDQARTDLEALVTNIEKYNPALLIYNPEFKQNSRSVIAEVEHDLSRFEFFQAVMRICAMTNEGHIHAGKWQDDIHKGFLDNTYRYLPASLEVVQGKLYAMDVFLEDSGINKGDEIFSINGVPTEAVLEQLYLHIPSDGSIRSYQEYKLSQGFNWMYYMFIDQPEEYELGYREYGKSTESWATIPALTREKHVELIKSRSTPSSQAPSPEGVDRFYTFVIEDPYAILTLRSFDFRLVEEYDLDAKKLYQEIFGQLNEAEVNALIVDIRGNTGGRNAFADEMIPFVMKGNEDSYLKKTVSWSGKEKTYRLPRPSKEVFAGDIYVLVDGATYSAGASLARFLREYGNATVIGAETGTRYEGFAAGSSQQIFLPESGLQIEIPRYHIYYPDSKVQMTSNRGLVPEIEIEPAIKDILDQRDPVMEAVLELVAQ